MLTPPRRFFKGSAFLAGAVFGSWLLWAALDSETVSPGESEPVDRVESHSADAVLTDDARAIAAPEAAVSSAETESATDGEKSLLDSVLVEPGTPEKYLKPYMPEHKLAEIWRDGTQVYHEVPFQVRQPDGSMKVQTARIEIRPEDVVPVRD
ncbi:MAG: hypothetical protein RL885_10705 [Planctomycetota bacterium]